MKDKTKLLILFGGVSSEHEVSRVSASSILTHINGEKYEIYTVGITKEGNWFLTSSPAVRIGDGSWEQDPANKNVALSLDRASRGLVVLEDTSMWFSRCFTAETEKMAGCRDFFRSQGSRS